MNDTNPLTELKATWVVSDFNRREGLLKIIRGKPAWRYYASGVIWLIVILYILRTEEANDNTGIFFALMALGFTFVGVCLDFSRRMNALIELIGEENLRKPKTDDKEQNA